MKKFLVPILLLPLVFIGQALAAAPAAITDLQCANGTSLGTVWLSWTAPAGLASSNAYEAKYSQGNTIDYPNATTFSQSWGTGSGSAQNLVIGLNPGTQYTFAVRSNDGSGNWSPVSNPATCVTAASSSSVDNSPPQTQITYPAFGSSLPSGVPLTIKGVSVDQGSSSVQKVEVSLDGGATWNEAKAIGNDDKNMTWEYTWANPTIGNWTIQARATDWLNNVETPGNGVKISVVPATSAPPTVTPPGTPTVEQLQATVRQLQVRLIGLLEQLVAKLRAQLGR